MTASVDLDGGGLRPCDPRQPRSRRDPGRALLLARPSGGRGHPLLARRRRTPPSVPAVVRGTPDQAGVWAMTRPRGSHRIKSSRLRTFASLIMVHDAVRAWRGAARMPLSLVSQPSPGRRAYALGRCGRSRRPSAMGPLPFATLAQPPRLRLSRSSQGSVSSQKARTTGEIY